MKIVRRTIAFLVILIVLVGVYSTYIEGKLLTVKKHSITINENGKQSIKVVQFTDTQLGEFYSLDQLKKVVEKINSQKPDIVVFTGDLIDNAAKYDHIDDISNVLKDIKATIGKYAVYGNRDYGGGAYKHYKNIMKESGFKLLKNESDTIKLGNKNINILGADDGLLGNPSVKKTVSSISRDDINILLVHEPDLVDDYSDYPIDLALSGHSHGGQVYIPFYGPIKKNVLSEKYNKGFYDLNNEKNGKIYVNSGLGNTKAPFRLFNVPQISVFELKL